MNLQNKIRNFGTIVAALVILTAGASAQAEDVKPSGTLKVKETEVGLIIGGDWGKGSLTFGGSEHPFKMTGAKIGGVGITQSDVSGDVYNLNDVADFYGTYFKAEAGITGVVGREGSWVKNSKGVSLHLKSDSEGLALSIGVEGLEISK